MEQTNKRLSPYRWVIVIISALMVMVALGFCSSANGMYIKPITEALGIDRAAFSLSTSVRYIATSVVNLFFGLLIYKLGAKVLIMCGFVSLIISTFIYSIAETAFVFCIGGAFLGLGFAFTTTTMVGAVVNRWWSDRKGTVMGFILASNGVGAVIARNVLSPIIDADKFGFRNAYRIVIVILAVTAVIMLVLFRNDPKGERVRIEKKRHVATENDKAAFKKPYFYVALVCVFFTGFVLQGVTGIADPHFKDNSLDAGFITAVMSVHSLVLSGAKFGTGFIYDKFGIRVASGVCFISAVVAMTALAFVGNSTAGLVLAAVYCVLSSVALPLETVMIPIIARELFGESGFNSALGIFASATTFGFALGTPLSNLVFDRLGTYVPWIYASVAIIAVVGVVMNIVISLARRDRARLESADPAEAV